MGMHIKSLTGNSGIPYRAIFGAAALDIWRHPD